MAEARLLIGDVFERMAELPDGSVDLVLTSPPFLALRSYLPADHPDKAKEIGSEPTPAEFLDTLLALAAEWRRVLAPHGSIAVELGDTYAGSGGAGGDYNEDGLREGQQKFSGSASKRARLGVGDDYRPARTGRDNGWPLDKSLCGIPHLFHLSLSYGVNLLTGQPSPAGQWRVRNVVAWCRPNPPVGALGDKFRPATSYMTIATVARDRYFDLDAVRTQGARDYSREDASRQGAREFDRNGKERKNTERTVTIDPAGAPPLDYWEIPTSPYKGAHYATWPPALCRRPIDSMVPHQVCTTCGAPRERLTAPSAAYASVMDSWTDDPSDRLRNAKPGDGQAPSELRSNGRGGLTRSNDTLGWSHCGCGEGCTPTTWRTDTVEVEQGKAPDGSWIDLDEWDGDEPPATTRTKRKRKRLVDDIGACADESHWRRGLVLDPFAGSGTTLSAATGAGRDAIGIDLDDRNAKLALDRVGPLFLTVEYPNLEETPDA